MKKSYISFRLLFIAIIAGVLSALTACESDYKLGLDLAVNQEELDLGASGGSTHVMVYSTHDWTATIKNPEDASWASIEKASGSGNGEFIFNYVKNPGIGRKAVVVISTSEGEKEITLTQAGYVTVCEMVLMKQTLRMPSWEAQVALALNTNLDLALEQIKTRVEYGDFDTSEGADNSELETDIATADNPGWLTDVTVEADSIRYKVSANTDGQPRKARVTLYAKNASSDATYKTSTIITQEAETGFINFHQPDIEAEVESFEKTVLFGWDTNMEQFFNRMFITVAYQEAGEEWISDFGLAPQGLQALIHENTTRGERHATITVSFTGKEGSMTATRKVVQAQPALEIPYDELRARLTSEGSVNLEKDYIMGYVISDPGNANLETNPHTTWNQVDYTVNDRTAYIESLDGTYGFRIRLADGTSVNTLPRYAKVKVALAGLTLQREDAPARYTLSNLTPANILELTPGNASSLPSKQRHINQLTDNDIYTYVTFTDMELAFQFGSWGNRHEGFAKKSDIVTGGNATQTRCDANSRYFRDINGDHIAMIVNSQTPWRREGKRVPQGSGSVKGIVVHSLLSDYNGNGEMGKYQFRVMDRADIQLAATESFTSKIAEWEWTGGSTSILKVAGSESKISANHGTGVMDTDSPLTDTKTALTTGFTGYTFASASPAQAFRYCGAWWNVSKKTGYNISWTFSTAGITGANRHLCMVFTAGGGKQAQPSPVPVYWNVEYSTDGSTFKTLKSKLLIYPSPIFAYTGMNVPAGLAEYIIDLPDELLGQQSVTVRIKAANGKYLTDKGINKGTIGASTANSKNNYMRFEAITIKYNK